MVDLSKLEKIASEKKKKIAGVGLLALIDKDFA